MLHVALLQLLSGGTREENLRKGIEACRRAKAMGADIALFPEMWNIGYALPEDISAWDALAEPEGGAYLRAFEALARELNMAVVATYLERYAPRPRNTATVIDRTGRRVLTYAKVHTCDFDTERHLTPGDDFPVAVLDTAAGPVRVGCMICYDREFPESARILMLRGAEVMLVPNACPMEINRLSQLRARAYENMACVATANYALGQDDCNGHSSAFDGIAYGPTQTGVHGARDTCVVQAGQAEGIYLAPLPLTALRAYRASEVHGNAYRRPGMYGALVEPDVRPPFRREDARR